MKEFKKLDMGKAQGICVKLKMYDAGTNREFAEMLNKVYKWAQSKDYIEIEDLKEIAEDIVKHTSSSRIEEMKKEYGANDEQILLHVINELNYATRVWID